MRNVTEHSFPFLKSAEDYSHLMWEQGKSRSVLSTPVFDVTEVIRKGPEGRGGTFTVLNAPEWVSIIPVFTGTDGLDYFVMERQYRHGTNSVTVEFPGGIVENGENPRSAACRELLEETGIVAHNVTCLGDFCPNSAIMSNGMHIFLMEDLEETGTRNFDENEQIDCFTVPVGEVIKNLGYGQYSNGIMLMGAFLYLRNKEIRNY